MSTPEGAELTLEPPPTASESGTDMEVERPGCAHCGSALPQGSELLEPPRPPLCGDCLEDQCHQCGRVDPINVDAQRRCFGCMREAVLRRRLIIGGLRGMKPHSLAAAQAQWHAQHAAQQHAEQQHAAQQHRLHSTA